MLKKCIRCKLVKPKTIDNLFCDDCYNWVKQRVHHYYVYKAKKEKIEKDLFKFKSIRLNIK